jgi:chromosome segregation ATPase
MSEKVSMAWHESKLQAYKTKIQRLEKRIANMADQYVSQERLTDQFRERCNTYQEETRLRIEEAEHYRRELQRITDMMQAKEPTVGRIYAKYITAPSRIDACERKWIPEVGSKAYEDMEIVPKGGIAKPYCEIVEALRVK